MQLSATMEQTHETQLAQLYDLLGFRRVIARYDVLKGNVTKVNGLIIWG